MSSTNLQRVRCYFLYDLASFVSKLLISVKVKDLSVTHFLGRLSKFLATLPIFPKMSGEVSRSRQKKAASAGAAKAKGQNQSAQNAAANLKYAKKKASKERQKMSHKENANKPFCSGFCLVVLLALVGVSYGTYHQYPEKVKEVYDNLPPQVMKNIFWTMMNLNLK